MEAGRILGVDYGAKNVGIAYADEFGISILPLPSLSNQGRRELLERIASIAEAERISRVVVGLPLNMNGSAGAAASNVRKFADQLAKRLGLPVDTVDERLSSVEAGALWSEMTPRRQRKYRTVDSLAAALILERYLNEK